MRKDYAEALKWFNRAIEKHAPDGYVNADAYANLAGMYAFGEGVTQDLRKAVELWHNAATMGNSGAQFNLGVLYAKGQAVEKDYVAAYRWICLSRIDAADPGLIKQIDAAKAGLESMMTAEQVKEALRLVQGLRAEKIPDPNGAN